MRKAGTFIEKTVSAIVSLLKSSVTSEEYAAKKGFLQQRDPRLKLLAFILMLSAVIASHTIYVIAAIYCLVLLMALTSRLKLSFFLKRTLLFIPLFGLIVVFPAIFSFVTPGEAVAEFTIFSKEIAITKQGLISAGFLLSRITTCVSISVLLILTTRHHVLLKALRFFRLPQIFIMTLNMTYRYIFLLLDMTQKSFTGIKSRVGYVTSARTGRKVIGLKMGNLWLKSYRMQNQVYDAMISRGYTGEPKVLYKFKAGAIDYFMLLFSIILLAGTIWLNFYIN